MINSLLNETYLSETNFKMNLLNNDFKHEIVFELLNRYLEQNQKDYIFLKSFSFLPSQISNFRHTRTKNIKGFAFP